MFALLHYCMVTCNWYARLFVCSVGATPGNSSLVQTLRNASRGWFWPPEGCHPHRASLKPDCRRRSRASARVRRGVGDNSPDQAAILGGGYPWGTVDRLRMCGFGHEIYTLTPKNTPAAPLARKWIQRSPQGASWHFPPDDLSSPASAWCRQTTLWIAWSAVVDFFNGAS